MVWMIEKEQAKEIASKYANHPDVMREIGEITANKPNLGAKFVDDPDEDWDSIYEVVGTKGKGQFYVYEFLGMHLRVQLRTANGKWELLDEEDDADESDAELEDDAEEELDLSEFPDVRQQGLGAPPEAGIGSEN